jgi:hypothetical protein
VAKLADAPDLGSGGAILRGSNPLPGISCGPFCTFAEYLSTFAERPNQPESAPKSLKIRDLWSAKSRGVYRIFEYFFWI